MEKVIYGRFHPTDNMILKLDPIWDFKELHQLVVLNFMCVAPYSVHFKYIYSTLLLLLELNTHIFMFLQRTQLVESCLFVSPGSKLLWLPSPTNPRNGRKRCPAAPADGTLSPPPFFWVATWVISSYNPLKCISLCVCVCVCVIPFFFHLSVPEWRQFR